MHLMLCLSASDHPSIANPSNLQSYMHVTRWPSFAFHTRKQSRPHPLTQTPFNHPITECICCPAKCILLALYHSHSIDSVEVTHWRRQRLFITTGCTYQAHTNGAQLVWCGGVSLMSHSARGLQFSWFSESSCPRLQFRAGWRFQFGWRCLAIERRALCYR